MGLSSPRNLIIASEASCVASCKMKYIDLCGSHQEKGYLQANFCTFIVMGNAFLMTSNTYCQNNFGGRSPMSPVYSRLN